MVNSRKFFTNGYNRTVASARPLRQCRDRHEEWPQIGQFLDL